MGALEMNEQHCYSHDIEETNNLQMELMIEYFKNQTHNIVYTPDTEDCMFWIGNFSEKFEKIWKSGIHNKETIKKKLYEN